eukprot:NODE_295_length_11479_cov_0.183480.p10 type:complete len:110 gc:universal NODE_295_length_11479_cov_0.183480:9378-9707(+)
MHCSRLPITKRNKFFRYLALLYVFAFELFYKPASFRTIRLDGRRNSSLLPAFTLHVCPTSTFDVLITVPYTLIKISFIVIIITSFDIKTVLITNFYVYFIDVYNDLIVE